MRTAPLLATLAVAAIAAPVLSGCGAEEAAGVDVAQAATATANKGTARVKMTMEMSGLGLPAVISLKADGVMSLKGAAGDLTFDLGDLLSAAGVEGDGKLKVRLNGADLFVDPPDLPTLDIPDGWLAINLKRVAEALGINPQAAAALFKVDPASQLQAFTAAAKLEDVGTEDIDGTETHHYKGAYSTNDTLKAMPPEKRAELEKALDELAKLNPKALDRDKEIPVELWVDSDNVVHKLKTEAELPSQNGVAAGRFSVVLEMSDFGTPLNLERPQDATDVTDTVVGALTQAKAVLGRSGQRGG